MPASEQIKACYARYLWVSRSNMARIVELPVELIDELLNNHDSVIDGSFC